jgi:hypothetical protein
VDLSEWLLGEFDESVGRLRHQVLERVTEERRLECPGGGNSIVWGQFHVARHTALALSVLVPEDPQPTGSFSEVTSGSTVVPDGAGLQEIEQPWGQGLTPDGVNAYSADVRDRARRYLAGLSPERLDEIPAVDEALEDAGVRQEEFGWLFEMWAGQPTAFFVRWPIIGHLANHVGEMIATRNRMGLSPF